MSERILKLNSLIALEVGSLILSEVDFKPGVFATISSVSTAHDLSEAKIHVQPFPTAEIDYIMKTLDHEKYMIQKKLHKKLHLKVLPKISFVADRGAIDLENIDQALSKDM